MTPTTSASCWSGNTASTTSIRKRLDHAANEDIVATIVRYEEQTRGWLAYMARAKRLEQQIEAYCRLHRHLNVYAAIRIIEFDEAAAVEFQSLIHLKHRIGVYDLRIAAIAKSRRATLLTRNLQDFGQVPGLSIEDWTRP